MSLITIKDKNAAEQVIQNNKYIVLHFYADWVLQCQNMNEAMEEMSKRFNAVKFCVLPAEEVPEISLEYNVAAVPTVILIKDSQLVSRIEGANPSLLRDRVKDMVGDGNMDINTRLERLINSHPVMLFMKGNREEPRCGFSREITQILTNLCIDYKTFDILSDQHVREALKTYSKWPTYPQLYIGGELIGGLDIVKEMVNSGDLQTMTAKFARLDCLPFDVRLRDLINSYPVMLFMKGDRVNPRCGFSRQIIQLLNDNGADYKTFDILEDNAVREGLKEYSKWPTYPQLYIKGEFIGGLDICKEMELSGQFKQIINS